jgi:hypothetical protein
VRALEARVDREGGLGEVDGVPEPAQLNGALGRVAEQAHALLDEGGACADHPRRVVVERLEVGRIERLALPRQADQVRVPPGAHARPCLAGQHPVRRHVHPGVAEHQSALEPHHGLPADHPSDVGQCGPQAGLGARLLDLRPELLEHAEHRHRLPGAQRQQPQQVGRLHGAPLLFAHRTALRRHDVQAAEKAYLQRLCALHPISPRN